MDKRTDKSRACRDALRMEDRVRREIAAIQLQRRVVNARWNNSEVV